jgi:hypothetical protein
MSAKSSRGKATKVKTNAGKMPRILGLATGVGWPAEFKTEVNHESKGARGKSTTEGAEA